MASGGAGWTSRRKVTSCHWCKANHLVDCVYTLFCIYVLVNIPLYHPTAPVFVSMEGKEEKSLQHSRRLEDSFFEITFR